MSEPSVARAQGKKSERCTRAGEKGPSRPKHIDPLGEDYASTCSRLR